MTRLATAIRTTAVLHSYSCIPPMLRHQSSQTLCFMHRVGRTVQYFLYDMFIRSWRSTAAAAICIPRRTINRMKQLNRKQLACERAFTMISYWARYGTPDLLRLARYRVQILITIEGSPPECEGSPHPQNDHKVTGQRSRPARSEVLRLAWQPKVSLASCTPVQRKEKCSTSTCSPGYAIIVVTVRT